VFAIKLKGFDTWAPKRNVTYFVREDGDQIHTRARWSQVSDFGASLKRRQIWNTTEGMRRSLGSCKGKIVLVQHGILGMWENDPKQIGSFSHYEVHDLVNGTVHTLEDVFSRKI